jgi:hypothetical protein
VKGALYTTVYVKGGRAGRQNAFYSNQDVGLTNQQKTSVETIGEKKPLTNLSTAVAPKENPDALAGANGAMTYVDHKDQQLINTPKQPHFASEYPDLASRYGDDLEARIITALNALSDLEPWQAEMAAAKVLNAADAPIPPFLGGMDEARFWASIATPSEIDCYAAACFEVMPAARQSAFLGFVQGRAAA